MIKASSTLRKPHGVIYNALSLTAAAQELLNLLKQTASSNAKPSLAAGVSRELEEKIEDTATQVWKDCFDQLHQIYANKEHTLFLEEASELLLRAEPFKNSSVMVPILANTYALRGNVYRQRGTHAYPAAIEDYQKALALDSTHPLARKGLESLAIEQGKQPIKAYHPFQPDTSSRTKPS